MKEGYNADYAGNKRISYMEIKRAENMARDDYFVIAYRILAYLYACLKEGKPADISRLNEDSEELNISCRYWEYIFRHLYGDGYIEGVSLLTVAGQQTPAVKIERSIMITPKGIEYLQENSTMAKAKKFLKDFKDITPCL